MLPQSVPLTLTVGGAGVSGVVLGLGEVGGFGEVVAGGLYG